MKSAVINEIQDPEILFLEAYKHEEKGDLRDAFKFLLRAAQMGHTGSQINLGNFYSLGQGVRKSSENAAYWYRQAYKRGDSTGAYNLAIDKKKEGNIRSAIIWFKKALALHYGEAAIELAKIYMNKRGGKKVAIELLRSTQPMNRTEISAEAKEDAAVLLLQLIESEVPRALGRQ